MSLYLYMQWPIFLPLSLSLSLALSLPLSTFFMTEIKSETETETDTDTMHDHMLLSTPEYTAIDTVTERPRKRHRQRQKQRQMQVQMQRRSCCSDDTLPRNLAVNLDLPEAGSVFASATVSSVALTLTHTAHTHACMSTTMHTKHTHTYAPSKHGKRKSSKQKGIPSLFL